MFSNGFYITSILKRPIVLYALIGGLFFNCKSTYSDYEYGKLEDLTIGNGLAFHPTDKLLLVSKPIQKKSQNEKPLYRIFQFEFKNENRCCEKEVPFSSKFTDYHPVFSPDGKWVYFNSDRPAPTSNKKPEKINIWRVKYNNGTWDDPEYLAAINTENHESYPTLTRDGMLHFNSDRLGGKGSMDIYKSEYINDQFMPSMPVEELNSTDSENDLFVDPQERFIILNRYLFDTKEIELFISHKKNGGWSAPEPINDINKKGVWELTPTPDVKFFFYEVNGKILKTNTDEILR